MSMQKSGSALSWFVTTDCIRGQPQNLLILLARLLIGTIFILSGSQKLSNIAAFVATMPQRGLPDFLGYIAPFVEVAGGALMIVGLLTRPACLIMIVFTLVASFSTHDYWASPPAQAYNNFIHFWKNVSIMGGMLLLLATGPGKYALAEKL
jgi:putative oxidoreductase